MRYDRLNAMRIPLVMHGPLVVLALWAGVAAASSPGPVELPFKGRLGFTSRLADGRLFAVYLESRPALEWKDVSIPQHVVGRFSSDEGAGWSDPQVLFSPAGPGILHAAYPLGTRDGNLHIFYLQKLDWDRPVDWSKTSALLMHTVSRDGGRSWQEPRSIDYGAQYTGALNSVVQLASGRLLVPLSYLVVPHRESGAFASTVVYSDDAGKTWKRSPSAVTVDSGGKIVESGAIEPVVAELPDGRVWMVMRTQAGYMFESFSSDGGATWSPARKSVFRATNSPGAVLRLRNGSTVIAWNNEFDYNLFHGVSYCRQVMAMAIDDGAGWRGYRQVSPPIQASEDIRSSVGYPFLLEAKDGGILLGYNERRVVGGRAGVRLFRVRPEWLRETASAEDFSAGVAGLYTVGTKGLEVTHGPEDRPAVRIQRTRAFEIGEPLPPSGMTWNFPFGRRGSVNMKVRLDPGFGGADFTLSEYSIRPYHREGGVFRWSLGSDLRWRVQYANNGPYLPANPPVINLLLSEPASRAETGRTLDLTVKWDAEQNVAWLYQDGRFVAFLLGLEAFRGISYLRLTSTAADTDPAGFLLLGLRSRGEP